MTIHQLFYSFLTFQLHPLYEILKVIEFKVFGFISRFNENVTSLMFELILFESFDR